MGKSRFMPSGPLRVVCAIIFHSDRLLATRRDATRAFPLHWEFPGGKLESDETPEDALHRELEEELSLKVRIIHSLEPEVFESDGHHIELIPILCRPDQSHGLILHDHVEARWIEPDTVGKLKWAPADVPLLDQLPELLKRVQDQAG